jgi:RPA family protein
MPHFRPYQVIPGHPITITITAVDGGRAEVVGTVAKVTDVASPSTVLRMEVVDAHVRPLPAK